MCTTHFSTYVNCHHRPFRRTRCALYTQDHRNCSGKVEVRTNEGFVCPACFDKIIWVRSIGEWEIIEIPEGDLQKDDWEEVERVGYDWQEDNRVKDVKDGVEGRNLAALATNPVSEKSTETGFASISFLGQSQQRYHKNLQQTQTATLVQRAKFDEPDTLASQCPSPGAKIGHPLPNHEMACDRSELYFHLLVLEPWGWVECRRELQDITGHFEFPLNRFGGCHDQDEVSSKNMKYFSRTALSSDENRRC
ncbi:hypothetical protein NHQ30_011149 [Ciborinia camelliae]|nr:hypothetical protein NHQ30_011149 [Ciborinia camelliae]